MSQLRALRNAREDVDAVSVCPAGGLVRLALLCGCPISAIARGARVDALALVRRPSDQPRSVTRGRPAKGRGRRRLDAPLVGVTLAEALRLVAWVDWVLAAHAWSSGVAPVSALVVPARLASYAGCDLSAWAPGGVL